MGQRRLFGFPRVGWRAGLGNLLFPWARCIAWCEENNATMIAPFWTQVRIGPYIRNERCKGNYQRFLGYHRAYIRGARRAQALIFSKHLNESSPVPEDATRSTVVNFEGLGNWFEPFISRQRLISEHFHSIVKKEFQPSLPDTPFIGIHVRLGDFSLPPDLATLRSGRHNYRQPIEWYAHVLSAIRAATRMNLPAVICTDGSDRDVALLLEMKDVTVFRGASSVTELAALSGAAALISSGSTFSMWASFLGQVPAVWFPGQLRGTALSGASSVLEPELDFGESLPIEFAPLLNEWNSRRSFGRGKNDRLDAEN